MFLLGPVSATVLMIPVIAMQHHIVILVITNNGAIPPGQQSSNMTISWIHRRGESSQLGVVANFKV